MTMKIAVETMKRGLLLLVLGACAFAAQAEIYKWVDADGKVQYGDAPPKEAKTKKVSGGVTVVPATVLTAAPASAPTKGKTRTEAAGEEGARGAINRKPEATSASSASASQSSTDPARQRAIDTCEKNRGNNCENEVDFPLNGQSSPVFVPVPGWGQPPIRPRHPAEQHASSSSERSYRVAPPPSSQSSSRHGSRKSDDRDRD